MTSHLVNNPNILWVLAVGPLLQGQALRGTVVVLLGGGGGPGAVARLRAVVPLQAGAELLV